MSCNGQANCKELRVQGTARFLFNLSRKFCLFLWRLQCLFEYLYCFLYFEVLCWIWTTSCVYHDPCNMLLEWIHARPVRRL